MTTRFQRAPKPDLTGAKLRNLSMSPGEFLARLWTLFGPPGSSDDGFTYALHDTETGLTFRAYSGPSGPAYGGAQDPRLIQALDAFDRLLANTPLADCRIEIGGDFGPYEIGARDGVPFDRAIATGPDPKTARTIEDCLAIARAHGEALLRANGHGPRSPAWRGALARGFAACLRNVVELRDMVIDGQKAEAIALTPSATAISVFFDAGTKTHDVPLLESEVRPLGEAGERWLEAYAAWQAGTLL